MKDLISRYPASRLFRTIQGEDSTIDANKLIDIFVGEFPGASPAAAISIRKWVDAGGGDEFPDTQIDGLILHYLRSSRYLA